MRTKRFGALAVLLAMLALLAMPTPAMGAQDPDPAECGNFAPLCEGLQEVGNGISPITDGLDAVTDPAADNLAPLLDALEGGVAQLRAILGQVLDQIPCDQVQPIINELQVVIDDVQGVLDVATAELLEAAEGLEGILAEANGLIDDVLDICVAQAGESETPEPTEDPTDDVADEDDDRDAGVDDEEDVQELPMTGGGAALGGLLLLGAAGLLVTRIRRRP